MIKSMVCVAAGAALVVCGASRAQAQSATTTANKGAFVSLAVGGQPTTQSFTSSSTFPAFAETGRSEVNQNIGAGFLFDVAGGYRFSKNLSAGASVWNARSKSSVSAAAAIPDPVLFGKLTTVTAPTTDDLNQSTLGVNIFVMYSVPLDNKFDLSVSGGPTIVRGSLDVGTATVAPNSQTVTVSNTSQSKTSAKAGNVGVDLTYHVNEMYGVGFFVRYAGGQLDLPAVNGLKVGGVQAGGLIRYAF